MPLATVPLSSPGVLRAAQRAASERVGGDREWAAAPTSPPPSSPRRVREEERAAAAAAPAPAQTMASPGGKRGGVRRRENSATPQVFHVAEKAICTSSKLTFDYFSNAKPPTQISRQTFHVRSVYDASAENAPSFPTVREKPRSSIHTVNFASTNTTIMRSAPIRTSFASPPVWIYLDTWVY